jgi:hypothetical protein
MLNALWTDVVLSNQCQTCIEVKLPLSASSCETNCENFATFLILVLQDKLLGLEVKLALSVIYLDFWLIIPLMLKMFSTNIWLSSRLLIMGLTRCEGMGSKWKVCLMAMLWIYNVLFERWQWLQIMKQSWKIILLWILLLDYGPSLALLVSSNTSSQNS